MILGGITKDNILKIFERKISIKRVEGIIKNSMSVIKFAILIIGVMAASIALAAGYYTTSIHTVLINNNDQIIEVTTRSKTVEGVLKEAGVILNEDDFINYSLNSDIDSVTGMINIKSPVTITINVEEEEHVLTTFRETVSMALQESGIAVSGQDIIYGAELDDNVEEGMEITVVKVEDELITDYQEIDFETVYIEDKVLYEGTTIVRQEGSKGSITRTYKIVKENGIEVSRMLIKEVIVDPIKRIVAYGTVKYISSSRGSKVGYSATYNMTATAYSPTKENHYYATASGNRAREGVVAVDRSVIPLGTKLYVKSLVPGFPDYGYCIAWDVGGGIKGNRIDLFMELESACDHWGVRKVVVYVLNDQSVDVFALRESS